MAGFTRGAFCLGHAGDVTLRGQTETEMNRGHGTLVTSFSFRNPANDLQLQATFSQ